MTIIGDGGGYAMKNSPIFMALAICSMLIAAGCASPYIGKKMSPSRTYGIYATIPRHHTAELKDIILDYDCMVDKSRGEISFEGTLSFRKDIGPRQSEKVADFTLIVLFMDSSRKILEEKYVYLPGVRNTYDVCPINCVLPYDDNYSYVGFLYEYTYYK